MHAMDRLRTVRFVALRRLYLRPVVGTTAVTPLPSPLPSHAIKGVRIVSTISAMSTRISVSCLFLVATCLTGPLLAATPDHLPGPLFRDGIENIADGPVSVEDAARFLAQATFGPTDADIAHLREVHYQGWLNEQFSAAPSLKLAYHDWVADVLNEGTGTTTLREAWFLGALGGPDPQNNAFIHSDQLRQRVAFALSEIFVISDQNTLLAQFPNGTAHYYDILGNNAFGNFRTLLEQVTLSPACTST